MSPRQILFIVIGSLWIVLNMVTFCIYGVDKRRAKRNRNRISEGTLVLLAILGGTVGAYLGMTVFHHKTNKKRFRIGIPLVFVVQAALVIALVLTL